VPHPRGANLPTALSVRQPSGGSRAALQVLGERSARFYMPPRLADSTVPCGACGLSAPPAHSLDSGGSPCSTCRRPLGMDCGSWRPVPLSITFAGVADCVSRQ
jgi:hypothetical protein